MLKNFFTNFILSLKKNHQFQSRNLTFSIFSMTSFDIPPLKFLQAIFLVTFLFQIINTTVVMVQNLNAIWNLQAPLMYTRTAFRELLQFPLLPFITRLAFQGRIARQKAWANYPTAIVVVIIAVSFGLRPLGICYQMST